MERAGSLSTTILGFMVRPQAVVCHFSYNAFAEQKLVTFRAAA